MTEYGKWRLKETIRQTISVALIGLALFACVYSIYRIERHTCYTRYKNYQPEYVGAITGCMITVDDQRIPADALRMTI